MLLLKAIKQQAHRRRLFIAFVTSCSAQMARLHLFLNSTAL